MHMWKTVDKHWISSSMLCLYETVAIGPRLAIYMHAYMCDYIKFIVVYSVPMLAYK